MRNLLFLLLFAAGSICVSCNSGGMSATAKKNMEINDAIVKGYGSGNFDKMGDYIAADGIDHGGEHGDLVGLDSIVANMKRYQAMMPDMKSTTTKVFADDEYVFTWSTSEGTMGGQKIKMTGVDVTKFKDGKAVEHWVYMDPNDMAKMMPPPPPPAAPIIDSVSPGNK
ncbi:MAG: ester cyclase [Chitinophagaceae bacterium]|nr:ester cyclase [Chitinophagaceae bacterium]